VVAIIDTKWKRLSPDPLDRKHGVSQADVYQMMAYARVYGCERLMLLYPSVPGAEVGLTRRFGIHGGAEMLAVGRVDVAMPIDKVTRALDALVRRLMTSRLIPVPA
jgi:5-methylcytosine-specific restriction enzyme subunit McrC